MKKLSILATVLLAACGTTKRETIEKPTPIYVKVREVCPPAEERARLKELRPRPLREGTMPPSPAERVAKSEAQLGLYEAEGGYADQVDAALDRCQQRP